MAALLTHCNTAPGGSFRWRIAQGVEMGRPSILEARTEKREGAVVDAWIGGASVMVSDGYIEVGERRSRRRAAGSSKQPGAGDQIYPVPAA